jgi:hypothetical protein
MKGTWQLAVLGGVIAVVVLVVSGFLLFERGGKNSSTTTNPCGTTSTTSYGNADISVQAPPKPVAQGGPFQRNVVVRPKDRRSGISLHGAKVVIHGEMCSHVMSLYQERLKEAGRGIYKGPYTLVMPGDWRMVIIVTSNKGDTSTSALPVRVIG